MTVRRVLLPSELPDEATSVTSSDWGVIQVSGERKLRKIRPGVLPAKSVGAAEIADKAVTRAQMADSTIQVLQLADNAVETAKIKDKAVTLAKLADVTGYRLIGRSVSTAGQPMEVTCTSFIFELLNDADADEARATLAAMGTAGGTFTGTIQRTNGMYILAPGVSADPVYAYQGDTNTGICFPAADDLGFTTGGKVRCLVGASGNFRPWAANTYYCGTSAFPWLGVYGKDAYVATSDSRLKTDVVDSDLGLSFIATLRPVSFRWRETGQVDAQGTPSQRPGVRPHYGLIAQEVRQALDGLGHDDFAGYCYDADDDTYALRYSEFIAPLIKAVQELAARVEELEAQLGV